MSSYDCDLPSVYESRKVRARKLHRCGECRHPIIQGEEFLRHAGCTDGRWWHVKECVCCSGKRCALADLAGVDCIPFGELAEFEMEYGCDSAPVIARTA